MIPGWYRTLQSGKPSHWLQRNQRQYAEDQETSHIGTQHNDRL